MAEDVTEPKIRIRNLYKIFGEDPAAALAQVQAGASKAELLETSNHVLGLRDINLDIPAHGLQVIMGLSGSGKSTLIRHFNRLIDPTAGEILVDGEDVMAMNDTALRDLRRFKMSMVFQKFGLLPHRTVQQNVEYGVHIQGLSDDEAQRRAARWIDRVGLAGFEQHYPGQLSGGMQQRVGLARALATDADILLMDEAFSALDPLIRTDMQTVLLDLQAELQKTIVFITHDLDEALRIGDSIAILRDGEVVQAGDPQAIIMDPADAYITDFIKDINRAKVIRIRSIMVPGPGGGQGAPVRTSQTIEEILGVLHDSPDGVCPVIDKAGKTVGTISMNAVIGALESRKTAEVARYS